ncbi:MAG: HAD-IIIC family phosphatase [Oscillospiraceae bacterium]|jgi:FkbH-like protein|nr:HAD-IIIC family phosphatase [Oscillospiraceae bacterium]
MNNENKIKCVVWDLDNTIWEGILSEEDVQVVDANIVHIIKTLDSRGILQSISSKNTYERAKEKLVQFGIWEYFIYPQLNWDAKSEAMTIIAQKINIGIDTLAFVDDQEFELQEVAFTHPQILCIHVDQASKILDMDRMNPKFITCDSQNRRKMYQNDIQRDMIEKDFCGTKEDFLATLNMVLIIGLAMESDLERMEELTVRTHQLNSTGYVYSYNELKSFMTSDSHELLVAQLDDKFGEYGKIGLALIERTERVWDLKLLLMSCRVMAKGVGNVLLNLIINRARKSMVALHARFVPTEQNRVMYITYKFNGFKEKERNAAFITMEADLSQERQIPTYVQVRALQNCLLAE